MEVYAVAILVGAGYVVSRMRQKQTMAAAPIEYAVPAPVVASDAPTQRNVWDGRRFRDVLVDEQARGADMARKALDPRSSGVIGGGAVHSSNTVRSPLLGVEMPIEKFTHNNMVPFYRGSGARQPQQPDAFQARLEMFTGAFDNVRPTGVREESEPRFEMTSQGPISSSGRPANNDYETARAAFFTGPSGMPRNRANEVPDEISPEIVGRPGVAGGKTGDVYFDMRDAVYQPTVDDLRPISRPKITFDGRILPPSATSTAVGRPDMPVEQQELRRGGPLTTELKSVNDLIRTKAAYASAEMQRPDDLSDIRVTNRQSTADHEYVGPRGSSANATAAGLRDQRYEPSMRRALPQQPIGVATGAASGGDYGKGSILVYGNNRDVTTVRTRQGNLVTAFKALVAPLQDAIRPTRKDEAVDAPRAFGNPSTSRVPKMTVYDPDDIAKTTLKEAMIQSGGASLTNLTLASGPARPTLQFDPDTGAARTCLKESMLSATPSANMREAAPARPMLQFDPDTGAARTCLKESMLSATPSANLREAAPARQTLQFDPDTGAARTCLKESTLSATPSANLREAAPARQTLQFDPDTGIARTCLKESTLSATPSANLREAAPPRATVYDPDDVARVCRMQTLISDAPAANLRPAVFGALTVHDPSDVTRTTRKEISLQEAPQANMRPGTVLQGTLQSADIARTTTRETTAAVDTIRNMGVSMPSAGASYDPESWKLRTTHREALEGRGDLQDGNIGGLQGMRDGAYTTTGYDPKATQREVTCATEGVTYGTAAASRLRNGAYTTSEFEAKTTGREGTSDIEYFGTTLAGGQIAQTSQTSALAMVSRSGDDREAVASGRDPTPIGTNFGVSLSTLGMVDVHRRTGGLDMDGRSPSPGRLRLSENMIDSDVAIRMGAFSNRLDDADHGSTSLAGQRLVDLVAGSMVQRSTNETAQPAWNA